MDFSLIYDTRHTFLILSRNFQLSCLPWIPHTICLSLIHLSFPSHLILCFLYPVYFQIHHSFLDSDITLTSPTLLSTTRMRHNRGHIIIILLFAYLSVLSFPKLISLFLSLLAGDIHRASFDSPLSPSSLPLARCGSLGLHAAVNPAASACLTPATSLAGQPEVAHTETHKRERTPDVTMTKPMPKSCGIKAIKLGKPLDWSSTFKSSSYCIFLIKKINK